MSSLAGFRCVTTAFFKPFQNRLRCSTFVISSGAACARSPRLALASLSLMVAHVHSKAHAHTYERAQGVTTACTGLGLAHELLLICLVPLIIVLGALAGAAARHKPLITVLPFALITSFLCFPFVASRGFRALAPCDCFSYVDGGAACFLHDAYSVRCVRQASGAYSAPDDVITSAWLAIFVYAVLVPALYASLLFICRRSLSGMESATELSRALVFLTKDYRPDRFFWELVEVARKITITGFLALIDPGSLLQLYLAVGLALCILILQLYASPYASVSDNFLSMISASALVLTLLASLGIQLNELVPDLSTLGVAEVGLTGGWFQLTVAVLIVSALLVLLIAVFMFAQQLNVARKLPFARWAASGMVAVPPIVAPGAFHAFISHQWAHGQDQARGIKAQLCALVPGLRVFLGTVSGDRSHGMLYPAETLCLMAVWQTWTISTTLARSRRSSMPRTWSSSS